MLKSELGVQELPCVCQMAFCRRLRSYVLKVYFSLVNGFPIVPQEPKSLLSVKVLPPVRLFPITKRKWCGQCISREQGITKIQIFLFMNRCVYRCEFYENLQCWFLNTIKKITLAITFAIILVKRNNICKCNCKCCQEKNGWFHILCMFVVLP